MKKVLLSLVFALAAMTGWAQGIMGKWVTEAGDAQVEIYQQGDKVNGKIVWLKKGDGTSPSIFARLALISTGNASKPAMRSIATRSAALSRQTP